MTDPRSGPTPPDLIQRLAEYLEGTTGGHRLLGLPTHASCEDYDRALRAALLPCERCRRVVEKYASLFTPAQVDGFLREYDNLGGDDRYSEDRAAHVRVVVTVRDLLSWRALQDAPCTCPKESR